jgi:hypothetical protein
MATYELNIPQELETDRKKKVNYIIEKRTAPFLRLAFVHSLMLLAVTIIDFTIDSDFWVDISLLGVVLFNIVNGGMLFFMKQLLEDINNSIMEGKAIHDHSYPIFLGVFILSSLIEIGFRGGEYIYFIVRNVNDINHGNHNQTREQNIMFSVMDGAMLFCMGYELTCFILLVIGECQCKCSTKQSCTRSILYVNCVIVILIHLGILTAVWVLDKELDDFLSDIPLWGLVLSNLLSTISFLPLWKLIFYFKHLLGGGFGDTIV